MLFKALIERLLGSDEAQDWKERDRAKTSRFSYNDYPTLPTILSNLLDPTGPLKKSLEGTPDSSSPLDLHGTEGVFPALQILRQARPSEPHLSPIRKFVSGLLASPHWHLRDMAARTYVSLHQTSELYDATLSLLSDDFDTHNKRHGTLLAIKYMLTKLLRSTSELSEYITGSRGSGEDLIANVDSPDPFHVIAGIDYPFWSRVLHGKPLLFHQISVPRSCELNRHIYAPPN
jgi:hypothetical protein